MGGGSSQGTITRRIAAASGALVPVVTPETARADLARAVRLARLRHPQLTFKQIAADAGLREHRLRRLIEDGEADRRYPRLDEALSLWAVLAVYERTAAAASTSLARIRLRAEIDDDAPEPLSEALTEIIAGAAALSRFAPHGAVAPQDADLVDGIVDEVIDAANDFRTRRSAL